MKKKYIRLKNYEKSFNKNQKTKTSKVNYGLAMLKVISAFLILTFHNFNSNTTKNQTIIYITINRKLHVPSFYIMSFYFMSAHLFSLNFKMFLKRLFRLLTPYIIWPIIFYKFNHYLNLKYHKKLPDSNEELKMQLLLGNRFNHPFWFQLDMITITILFFIIIFILRKFSLFVFQISLVFIYAVQYSGFDYTNYFKKYLKNDRYLVRYLFDSIPYTITGLLLGYYKMFDVIQKHKIKTFLLSISIYKIIADYNIFRIMNPSPYIGVHLNIQAICLVFVFSLFPSEYITNQYIQKFLTILTNYTAGVFYLHVPIQVYLSDYFYNIRNRTFIGMIQEYLFCYLICFIGMFIFGKTPLKYMFS